VDRSSRFRLLALVMVTPLPLLTPFVVATDWPQFRGAHRSGVSKETGLALEWSATKNIIWKRELPGPGSSSPIVFGDHVYLTCYSGYGLDVKAPGNLVDLKRHLVCVDRATGKLLWTQTETDPHGSDAPYKDGNIALHGYASHTPAADESGVYAYFGSAGAAGFSHGGAKKWRVTLGTNAKNNSYGSGASPVLSGHLLIVNACIETAELYRQGETIALDKRTGKEVWRQKAGGEWSSPLLATVGGELELVVATRRGPWLGLEPATGKRLWECEAKEYCGTPVAHDGVVYVVGGDSRAAIRAGGRGDVTRTHKLWDVAGGTWIPSPAYHDGHLYWSAHDGGLVFCADARTGQTVYKERLPGCGRLFASPLVADDRIYYVSRDHGTYVLAAKPKFELLAHDTIDNDKSVFNGSPAVSGGRLFLRSDKFLYCIGTK
jgi:outer membrane protein assembly factor BamB